MSEAVAKASRGRAVLIVILALSALARVLACFLDGPMHPDEYFQYLEPAWWRLTGVGIETWEWIDGIRSWVLPGYHGAWIVALRGLGLPKGPPLVWALKVHWALVNTALVWFAYRGAASVARSRLRALGADAQRTGGELEAGLLAALLVGAFPLLVLYSSHTLSEPPSLLCLIAGLTLCVELLEPGVELSPREERSKAFWCGVLLSLGACIRIANGPLVLLPPAWLLLRRRVGLLGWLLLGSALPAALFALVDLLTWGKLAGSFVAYVRFNFVEGKAADFGTEPPLFYYGQLLRRLRWTLGLLVLPPLWGLRASWPYVLQALLTLVYLSTQAHKEERFIIGVWPLLMIASAGVVGPWLARLHTDSSWSLGRLRLSRAAWLSLVAGLMGVWFVDALVHAGERGWPAAGRVVAQGWAGRQTDVTTMLLDYPIDGGGALWFGNDAPHVHYQRALLQNPLVSHVLVQAGSERERESKEAGFVRIYRYQRYVVLRRKQP